MTFNVGAITATLGFRVDDDGAQKFDKRLRTLRSETAKPVTAELRGDLNPRDIELYERKLKDIRATVARRDQFKAQLGADYDSRAFNAMERDLRRNQKTTDDNVKAQGRLRTAFGSVSSAGAGMFAAAGGGYLLYQGLKSIVTASGEAETAQRSLEAQLRAIGPAAVRQADAIDRVIQTHSQLAGVDDEDLSKAFVNVARASGDVEVAMENMALVTDIARARNLDVAKAGDIVGKVLAGNTGILSRYGIVLKEGATTQEAIGALQDKFAGQARAYGRTQAGALDRVDVAWENLRETIGEKLRPTLTLAANAMAKFINQMDRGKGTGGEFVESLKDVWRFVKDVTLGILDFTSGFLKAAEATTGVGASLPGIGGRFRDVRDDIRGMRDSVDDMRESLRDTGKQADRFDMGKLRDENRKTGRAFKDMAKDGKESLADIAKVTDRRTREIREDLGKNSREGREALAENFRKAADAVRRQMRAGEITTRDGMRQIRAYLSQELQTYGLSIRAARNIVKGGAGGGQFGDPDANRGREGGAFQQRGGRIGRAMGGWLGARGMVGSDSLEVAPGYWAAPGEYYAKGPAGHGAVINRHQAPIVDLALMRGGHTLDSLPRDESALPRIEAALRDWGGLDRLFASVQRPHMLQGGGPIVPVPGFPGERANRSILDEIALVTRRFGLVLTDAFGPGHKSPGHTVTGTAADFAGPDAAMDRAVRFLVGSGYLVGYDGRYGSADWPGHGPAAGQGGSNAHLHVEFGTHGGAIPTPRVPRFAIKGGGAVGRVAQAALDMARSGAQGLLDQGALGALSAPTAGGGTGTGSGAALMRAISQQRGWNFADWWEIDRRETGHGTNLINESSGAFNRAQFMPGVTEGHYGPGSFHGASMPDQIQSMAQYIGERYGNPTAARIFHDAHNWYQHGGKFQGSGRHPNMAMGQRRRLTRAQRRRRRARRAELGWMQSVWNKVAPSFGQNPRSRIAGLFKHIYFRGNVPFVGVAWDDPSDTTEVPDMLWPAWMWKGEGPDDPLGVRPKTQLLVHELAHRFQDPKETPNYWTAEGGAEAFARRAMRSIFGMRPSPSYLYTRPYKRVEREKGEDWILHDQFRGLQRGGQFGRRWSGRELLRQHRQHRRRHPRNRLGAAIRARNERLRAGAVRGLQRQAGTWEDRLAVAELTPTTRDDLTALRHLESVYGEIVRIGSLRTRAEVAPQLLSVREQIDQLLHPDVGAPTAPDVAEAPEPVVRPPSAEEIAQGVSAQLASFQAARQSLFSQYGSNFTLAGQRLVPRTATGMAAGLSNFGALTSGAGPGPAPTRVINQTNVFPTPPPDPHLFARNTLFDLQAAP